MVLKLIGVNVAVYGLWRLADPKFRSSPYMVSGYPEDFRFDFPAGGE